MLTSLLVSSGSGEMLSAICVVEVVGRGPVLGNLPVEPQENGTAWVADERNGRLRLWGRRRRSARAEKELPACCVRCVWASHFQCDVS